MIHAKVSFNGVECREETYEILTYLRGESYWQFLCLNGTLKIIPESSISMIEIINVAQNKSEPDEE
tara:strand:+ start:2211 stop:2408 length:198 start_codon:yes stop_codon:yes gene_type:complete